MDRRIQQALDGELPRDDLPRSLAEELRETESLMRRIVNAVPEEPLPDLGPAVLDRIRVARAANAANAVASTPVLRRMKASNVSGIGAAIRWLWRPRPLQWRPAYTLAAAGLLVAAFFARDLAEPRAHGAPVAAESARVFVQFRLEAPQANEVQLAGNFTEWQPAYVLSPSPSGVWSVVVPLEPGVHEYAFVIDGDRWVADPLAPAVSDGFGGVNSRLAVLTPDAPRPL